MENYGKYTDKTEFRVKGYTNRWGIIDSKKVDDKEYFLLENNTWGDETFYLIVDSDKVVDKKFRNTDTGEEYILPTFTEVVCETFDDIDTALTDEGILDESLKESVDDKPFNITYELVNDEVDEENDYFTKTYGLYDYDKDVFIGTLEEIEDTYNNSTHFYLYGDGEAKNTSLARIAFGYGEDFDVIIKAIEDELNKGINESLKENFEDKDINPNEQGIFKAGNIIINTEPLFYCDKENLDIIFDDDEIEKIKTSNFIDNNGDFVIPKYSRLKVITKQSPGGGWPMLEILKLSEILGEPVELDFAYGDTEEEFEAMFAELR